MFRNRRASLAFEPATFAVHAHNDLKTHLIFNQSQNAQAALGERPADEAEAHAWDVSMHTVDAQAEQASAQDFADEATRDAYIRYMQREHLLHVRNQLAAGLVTQAYAGVTKADGFVPNSYEGVTVCTGMEDSRKGPLFNLHRDSVSV